MAIRETYSSDRVLDALGNQIRRDILSHLRRKPMAVGAIAARFPISRPAISKHLRLLEEAGLVEHSAQGTSHIFQLQPGGFQLAHSYLEHFWSEALRNFQAAVREHTQEEETS